jgi:hypothetical protein
MVAWLDGGDSFADTFYDAGAFVAENDWEGSFGVFSGQGVGIWEML